MGKASRGTMAPAAQAKGGLEPSARLPHDIPSTDRPPRAAATRQAP